MVSVTTVLSAMGGLKEANNQGWWLGCVVTTVLSAMGGLKE
ncbi:hypothetical protein [Nostoc sp.]